MKRRPSPAAELRELIAAKGHTQVSAADAIGISPRAMRRYVSEDPSVYRKAPRPVVLALQAMEKKTG